MFPVFRVQQWNRYSAIHRFGMVTTEVWVYVWVYKDFVYKLDIKRSVEKMFHLSWWLYSTVFLVWDLLVGLERTDVQGVDG